jgi:hypothetical protein
VVQRCAQDRLVSVFQHEADRIFIFTLLEDRDPLLAILQSNRFIHDTAESAWCDPSHTLWLTSGPLDYLKQVSTTR